ncbi:hypothetical protein B0J17DRAFT_93303 [Rhizoctonia solani]|nr:hypothetical protein B0J17DRAFT_93303 [Rhizoctonia solani]
MHLNKNDIGKRIYAPATPGPWLFGPVILAHVCVVCSLPCCYALYPCGRSLSDRNHMATGFNQCRDLVRVVQLLPKSYGGGL